MTPADLLTTLGQAWSRLLIYPGGLFMLALVYLPNMLRILRAPRSTLNHWRASRIPHPASRIPHPASLTTIAAPWLAIALLPLLGAAPLGRPIDLVVALALLEWPRLLAAAEDLRRGEDAWPRGIRRLAALLNGAPPLVLAALLFAQAAGSLELTTWAQVPSEHTSPMMLGLRWLGVAGITLTLPALLEVGPFAVATESPALGMRLRALGVVLVASLPFAAPLTAEDLPAWAILLTPLAPLLLVAFVWGVRRLSARQSAERWARAYLWLSGLLLAAHLLAAAEALRIRLE
jgi:hypothetical protein